MEPHNARNVVVVCLDSVRKDVWDGVATRLSERADVEYDQARAVSGWSVPSLASMFTGKLPSEHGVHSYNLDFGGLEDVDRGTVFRRVPGHETISVSANEFTKPEFGFDALVKECVSVSRSKRFGNTQHPADAEGIVDFVLTGLRHDRPVWSLANGVVGALNRATDGTRLPSPFDFGAKAIVRESIKRVQAVDEPVFLFTNFMEAHIPHQHVRGYDSNLHDAPNSWSSSTFDYWDVNRHGEQGLRAHEEEVEWFRGLYRTAIEYLDRVVAEFVDRLRETLDRPVSVVVTADHGENMGCEADRHLFSHTSSLTEGLLHVPLLVVNPPGATTTVGEGLVSHTQLPSILEDLADGTYGDYTSDQATAELVGGGTTLPDENTDYWDRTIRAVYDYEEECKWVWDALGTTERVDLDFTRPCWQAAPSDATPPTRAKAAFSVDIGQYDGDDRPRLGDGVDDAVAGRLEELGYL